MYYMRTIYYICTIGGPGQWSHLAPTYAAVNALCIIGTEESFNSINRYVSPVFHQTIQALTSTQMQQRQRARNIVRQFRMS